MVALLALLAGCQAPVLEPGEWGPLRYFDEIPGTPALRVLPPISDRDGNVYVLYGDRDRTENLVYVGHSDGGWSGGCQAHEGLFGVHGFVGRSTNRAWYWSGDALVAVDGDTGSCHEVIDTDPVSGTDLRYVAVIPWVQDTPSRTYAFAMVQGPSDPAPFHAVIDLDHELYSSIRSFEVQDADEIEVVGTGADPDAGRGYVVVNVVSGKNESTSILFLNQKGASLATVQVDEPLADDAIVGFVQAAGGIGGALLDDGRLLTFDDSSSEIVDPTPLSAEGFVRFKGQLYVTGVMEGVPVVAEVGVGGLGNPQTFTTSGKAAEALEGSVRVLDERSDPTRDASWDSPTTALGTYPFLSPYGLDAYTNEATGWLVAGPAYQTGIEDMTAVAFGPVGFQVP